MYEAELHGSKGQSVSQLKSKNRELAELLKQNTAAMNQRVSFLQQQQQQQPSSEPKRNG